MKTGDSRRRNSGQGSKRDRALSHPLAHTCVAGQPTRLRSNSVAYTPRQMGSSGIYFNNREVPIPLPMPLGAIPEMRKRRRVEPPSLQRKAMLPAPALFNAFEQSQLQRCVSPVVVPVKCYGINHNLRASPKPANIECTVAPAAAPGVVPTAAPAAGEDVGCREAAMALSSLCCPSTTKQTQPLAPSATMLQSYNHATPRTPNFAPAPPSLQSRKPFKPLD